MYDRVRENLRKYKTMPLRDLIDLSINETLNRTLGTSMTVFLASLPLALFGGESLSGFAWVMLFGIVVGTSSSIFIAAPILLLLGEHRLRRDAQAPKPAARQPAALRTTKPKDSLMRIRTHTLLATVIGAALLAAPLAGAMAQQPPPPGYHPPPPPGYRPPPPPPHRPPMPPPRYEPRPPPPPGAYSWHYGQGHWHWNGYRWVWVQGRWYR